MKKLSAISSPGDIRKLVFALEANPAPSLREEVMVDERKVLKRHKIMTLTAKKLMIKRVQRKGNDETVSNHMTLGERKVLKATENATNSEETGDKTRPKHGRLLSNIRTHHANDCKKPDGSTCDKCKKNTIFLYTMKNLAKQTQV